MQPHEFYSLIDGYNWRREERQIETAYWISQLLNMSGKVAKNKIKPEELVKPLQPEKKKKRNTKEDLACLKKAFPGLM